MVTSTNTLASITSFAETDQQQLIAQILKREWPLGAIAPSWANVALGIASGWSNARIGRHYGLTQRTVENYSYNLYESAGLNNPESTAGLNRRVALALLIHQTLGTLT